MDCRACQERIARLAEGTLPGALPAALERHLERCGACREIERLVRSEPAAADGANAPETLLDGVLARTSGSACVSAEPRLCEYVDRETAGLDRRLLAEHLAGCPDCAELVRILQRMEELLPQLAELPTDRRFVRDVLRATLPLHRRWAMRFNRTVSAWMQRPRFALEGAYVGAFALAIAFAVPGSPLAGTPKQALEIMSKNPVTELRGPATAAWEATGAKALDGGREIAGVAVERSQRAWSSLSKEVGTLWHSLTSELVTDDKGEGTAQTAEGEHDDE